MNSGYRSQPPILPVEFGKIPETKLFLLKNRVPVYLIDAGIEDLVRIEFIFRAGNAREDLPLLASTTNMMLTEGSESFSSAKLNRLLDYYGAFYNLSAEKDRAGIVIIIINKHIEKVLELVKEILFRPLFPATELKALMKKRLSWYLVNSDKVHNLATDQFFESIFGKRHPYGRKVIPDDFENMNSALLMDFHSKYYSPENMAVIISGKILKRTTSLLNSFFGDINFNRIYIEDSVNMLKKQTRKKVHLNKRGALQAAIRIGSPTINKRHPDYPGLKILDVILGGYFSSRLMKNIREEKGFTYGISSMVSSLDLSGFKVISTEVSKKNTQKTIDEIYNEIRLLQTKPVEKAELEIVRNYMLGEMVRMFDGPFAIAESFKSAWEFDLDNSYYYRFADKIKTIDPDEITALARTYYNIDELYEITAG
ncbi:MAG: insulinase family protein [Bacteroidales bacterium]|nr:insulinase family protein [Bacteroidales bacterium]